MTVPNTPLAAPKGISNTGVPQSAVRPVAARSPAGSPAQIVSPTEDPGAAVTNVAQAEFPVASGSNSIKQGSLQSTIGIVIDTLTSKVTSHTAPLSSPSVDVHEIICVNDPPVPVVMLVISSGTTPELIQ